MKDARWVWVCEYDKGTGVDREFCGAHSKKPTTYDKAMLGGNKHGRHPGKQWGPYSHSVCVFRLPKYARWHG